MRVNERNALGKREEGQKDQGEVGGERFKLERRKIITKKEKGEEEGEKKGEKKRVKRRRKKKKGKRKKRGKQKQEKGEEGNK